MKVATAAIIVLWLFAGSSMVAQTQGPANPRLQAEPQPADLNAIVLEIQKATSTANVNIGKLRIERWKTDSGQKQQLQQVADSLQKNIANAVPGLVNDVQSSHGGVAASFKLYHNLNVLYEFLSSLADAAGGLGKRDEYEPLAHDAAALDTARQNLSIYIEQASVKLETMNRQLAGTIPALMAPTQNTLVPGKKVVVIDDSEPQPKKRPKATKKKPSATPAAPAPAATPAQSAASPH